LLSTTVTSYPHPQNTQDQDSDVEDELSAGEIAGIVIGSVIGFLLLLLLCVMCRNMGRSRAPPQYPMRNMPPSHPDTSMADMSDGPDILDYSGKVKPPAGK
jgi:hypothetical protein